MTVSATVLPGGEALITVRDTGIGIAPEQLDRIFDEFVQMQKPAKTHTGWGLGLAPCPRLVDILEGSIAVESVPGEGSTFRLTIPSRYVVKSRTNTHFVTNQKQAKHRFTCKVMA